MEGKPVPQEIYRCIFVFAPHTSNWDWYLGTLFMYSKGLPMKVAIKKFWLKFPFGILIKPLGGVAIDRATQIKGKSLTQVQNLAGLFKRYEKISFVITPEGSRSKRKRWKTGFYHIAREAQVPIVILKCDFQKRCVSFGPVLDSNEGIDQVMRSMMEFYSDAVAVFPEKFSLDERYI